MKQKKKFKKLNNKETYEQLSKIRNYLYKNLKGMDQLTVIGFLDHMKMGVFNVVEITGVTREFEKLDKEFLEVYDIGAKHEKDINEKFKELYEEINKLKK